MDKGYCIHIDTVVNICIYLIFFWMIHRLQSENTRLVRQVEDLTFWTGLRYRQLREADEASIRLLQQDSARSAFMDSLYGRVLKIHKTVD